MMGLQSFADDESDGIFFVIKGLVQQVFATAATVTVEISTEDQKSLHINSPLLSTHV